MYCLCWRCGDVTNGIRAQVRTLGLKGSSHVFQIYEIFYEFLVYHDDELLSYIVLQKLIITTKFKLCIWLLVCDLPLFDFILHLCDCNSHIYLSISLFLIVVTVDSIIQIKFTHREHLVGIQIKFRALSFSTWTLW